MILPPTTELTISRYDLDGDSSDAPTAAVATSAVSAHVSAPQGTEVLAGGSQEITNAVAYVDVGTDVLQGDRVVDLSTSRAYRVAWTNTRIGLGLDHLVVGLTSVEGTA